MEQQHYVYVPVLLGPSSLMISQVYDAFYPKNDNSSENQRRITPYLLFTFQGDRFNPSFSMPVDTITRKDEDNYYLLCHYRLTSNYTIVGVSRHEFRLKVGECYDFEINYNSSTRTGQVLSLGHSKKYSSK